MKLHGDYGIEPIQRANPVTPGAPQIVELLLKAKADPNVRDELSFSRAGALQWKLVENTDE